MAYLPRSRGSRNDAGVRPTAPAAAGSGDGDGVCSRGIRCGGRWSMCRLSWPAPLLLMVSLIVLTGTTRALTPLVHMTNNCGRTLQVDQSLILDLTEELQAERVLVGHLSCVVTLRAPAGARLYLHVMQLAISDMADVPDRLHVYDVSSSGKELKRLTPFMGLYGVLERPYLIFNTAGIIVPDFRSLGTGLRLDYQGKPTTLYRGFRVLVTVFHSPSSGGSCQRDTLYCPYSGTCIPLDVRCDSLPNCGLDDGTDEKSCQKEDVVANILDEYATRTAVIAGVAGIFVFLGVAGLVLFILVKYNRFKNNTGASQSVRYTARGGGACKYRNETNLARLYAPPSYEDVMAPGARDTFPPRSRHRHADPPPAYSAAVAALIHQDDADSSEDERSRDYRSRGPMHRPAHALQDDRRPPSLELEHLRGAVGGACAGSEEDVRMHGTWPSDTDEEEEVRVRRKRKGGKCKGRSGRSGMQDGHVSSEDKDYGATPGRNPRKTNSPYYENVRLATLSPVDHKAPPSYFPRSQPDRGRETETSVSSPSAEDLGSHSDCSPSHHHQHDPQKTLSSSCPFSGAGSDVTNGRSTDAVSETESQLAARASKRNSRTESNSTPYSSSSSSLHCSSPANTSPVLREEKEAKEKSPSRPSHLHSVSGDQNKSSSPSSSSVFIPASPNVCLVPKTLSEDSLHSDKSAEHPSIAPEDQSGFVDLNPPVGKKHLDQKTVGQTAVVDNGVVRVRLATAD